MSLVIDALTSHKSEYPILTDLSDSVAEWAARSDPVTRLTSEWAEFTGNHQVVGYAMLYFTSHTLQFFPYILSTLVIF